MAYINEFYDNFVLANEIEDQMASKLDLMAFATVDNDLTATAGMLKKIHRYHATDGVEIVEPGTGNTKKIKVSYTPAEYRVQMLQGTFEYLDEEAMTDENVVPTGINHISTDMYNTVNAMVMAEFAKSEMIVPTTAYSFDAFVDAQSMLGENVESLSTFALVNPKQMAILRKALKDSLQYVEAYARTGYIGTVGGTNVYVSNLVPDSAIYVATPEAITYFNKLGAEIEAMTKGNRSSADADIRKNVVIGRKCGLAALTDATKLVALELNATFNATQDTTPQEGTVYYEEHATGYRAVGELPEDANPKTLGLFVKA